MLVLPCKQPASRWDPHRLLRRHATAQWWRDAAQCRSREELGLSVAPNRAPDESRDRSRRCPAQQLTAPNNTPIRGQSWRPQYL